MEDRTAAAVLAKARPTPPPAGPAMRQLNGLFGYAMGAALHGKVYGGIVNDAMCTSRRQGGFLMQAWWHKMAGLLTEAASVALATPAELRHPR